MRRKVIGDSMKTNILVVLSDAIYEDVKAAKSVSKLSVSADKFRDYVHTCTILGQIPYHVNMHEGVSIDDYEVIDAVSCLSHYVARVNAVTEESLEEADHLVSVVPEVDVTIKLKDAYTDESGVEHPAVYYVPRELPVEEFNRITIALKGAIHCGKTTIHRDKVTLAKLSDMTHVFNGKYHIFKMDYAPAVIDTAIFDDYDARDFSDFKTKLHVDILKKLSVKQSSKKDSGDNV